MRLDELGQTFIIRLVIRLKTHYPSRRAIFCCTDPRKRLILVLQKQNETSQNEEEQFKSEKEKLRQLRI